MPRRIRVLFSGVTVLPLGLLVLSFGASAIPPTSGGCFYPTNAALDFAESFSVGFTLSSDPKICEQQCRDFQKGCKTTYKNASRCIVGSYDAVTNGRGRGCKEIQDSTARKVCESNISSSFKNFLDFIDSNNQQAAQICEDDYQECLGECIN